MLWTALTSCYDGSDLTSPERVALTADTLVAFDNLPTKVAPSFSAIASLVVVRPDIIGCVILVVSTVPHESATVEECAGGGRFRRHADALN